jgi:hypothetical protein
LKNRRHVFKAINFESSVGKLDDYVIKHWENVKHLIASEVKQDEAAKNRAMWALVTTPSHYNYDGEVGVAYKLVKSILHIPNMFLHILGCWLIFMHFCDGIVTSLHWVICFLGL